MNEIGQKIIEVLDKEDILNVELAEATGILRNNLSVILGPRGNPQWSTVKKILEAMGYEVILRKKALHETHEHGDSGDTHIAGITSGGGLG